MAQGELLMKECPDRPNCVSTTTSIERNKMTPISFRGSAQDAQEMLLSIISSMKGSQIIESSPGRIVTTFTSAIFRFVDDVEFDFDDSQKLIHFRSASRIGYYDLGVNRKRMEAITKAFRESDKKLGLR